MRIFCRQLSGCNELTPEGTLSLPCIVCDDVPLASSMNVLWQIPQFMLIGTSEILAAVTAMEFFYSEVRKCDCDHAAVVFKGMSCDVQQSEGTCASR
jgi:POT family